MTPILGHYILNEDNPASANISLICMPSKNIIKVKNHTLKIIY
jgi:hypothetical protein